ncbi:MAG: MBOAT family protein [Ruminococcaceae bacterium]|nr:MBOAT family protein [Oscillospiraceae bacterium]
MLFSSIPFLYYFLPLVILVYFLSPKFLRNSVLLLFSLGFYAWGEPKYVFLMIGTVILNYVLGLLIEKFRGRTLSKVFVVLSVVSALGALGYFKYADFFIENFVRITGIQAELLNIVLPIGISFYTFQILSYTVDVYRGQVRAQGNPITLGAYIALFPQLIAGPIVRYSDVERQLLERTHSFEKCASGIRRFILGLSKKILLANTLGELGEAFYAAGDKSVLFCWLFVFSYMLQVYFDFSGYSDMAIGLGKIFGFDFMENFRYPFCASSISDFWRRWHISLGSWFRDYVYIPMGGNRVKTPRFLLNIFTVWFLTGFWHGAEWNFIIWGLYFGVLLLAEKLLFSKYLKKTKVLCHFYVLFLVSVSFAIFSASGFGDAIHLVGGMFGSKELPLVSDSFIYNLRNYGFVLIIAALAATPLFVRLKERLDKNKTTKSVLEILEIPFLLLLLVVSTAYLVDGSFNPFLYFRF